MSASNFVCTFDYNVADVPKSVWDAAIPNSGGFYHSTNSWFTLTLHDSVGGSFQGILGFVATQKSPALLDPIDLASTTSQSYASTNGGSRHTVNQYDYLAHHTYDSTPCVLPGTFHYEIRGTGGNISLKINGSLVTSSIGFGGDMTIWGKIGSIISSSHAFQYGNAGADATPLSAYHTISNYSFTLGSSTFWTDERKSTEIDS